MSYRKFSADYLFTGSQLLTGNRVLITDMQGVIIDLAPLSSAGDDIEKFNGILCPGFVNTHCHLELSHLKGRIPENTGMIDFLLGVMGQRNFPADQVLEAIADGEAEMLRNGIVAVGDICNTADTLHQKRKKNLVYHNFVEATGFIEATAQKRFEASRSVLDELSGTGPGSIVPHAPYSVSPALLKLITEMPGNRLLTVHNQESRAENEFIERGARDFHRLYKALGIDVAFYKGSGKSSLQTYFPAFLPQQSVIFVHNVTTQEADIRSIANGQLPPSHCFFCCCPNANLYIGNGLPPIDLLRRSDARITIGTDSLASNHQLSVLEELKTIQHYFAHIDLRELLQWATLNGAAALQMEDRFGSFDAGKRPGVILLENVGEGMRIGNATVRRVV